jgi:plasmid stability protein
MPILHVRNVPTPLYRQIKKLAAEESRSFNSEVVNLLGRAVQEEQALYAQKKLLTAIEKRRLRKKLKPGTPDSSLLLREDRNR